MQILEHQQHPTSLPLSQALHKRDHKARPQRTISWIWKANPRLDQAPEPIQHQWLRPSPVLNRTQKSGIQRPPTQNPQTE